MDKNIYNILLVLLLLITLASCKQVKLADADLKFIEGEYYEAGNMYRKVYRQLPKKDKALKGVVSYRMGEAYRLSNNPLRASTGYANAVRYQVEDDILLLQYARTLHKLAKYEEAGKQYEEFLKKMPGNRFALNGLLGTKMAKTILGNPTSHNVRKAELLNSNRGEFAPALLPPAYDQVFFASNRKEAKGDTISGITGAKLNDIFMSRKDEKGSWMKPEHIQSVINTSGDEGAMSFSADGAAMYYTASPQDTLGTGKVNIYMANRSGGEWGEGTIVDINKRDTMSVYAHPAISGNREFLYYVSDTKGGYGGKDIWRARMVGDLVDYKENLGGDINTSGDEMFPYLRNDSTLYFASDGHAGLGGLDIFKAVYKKKTKRWFVENMRSPINSEGDDFGITFAGAAEEGFFSSNRGDMKGYDHLYEFVLPRMATHVEGYLVDTDDEFLDGVTVRMVGRDGTNKKIQAKANGTYTSEIDKGVDYVFLASKKGYLNFKMNLQTENMRKDSTYLVDFVLTPIHKPVVLDNVFYEFDKATLTDGSKDDLNSLIDLLNVNPNVTIELSAHTDRKGSDEYNNNLSQKRAESVVNYLIKGGIAKERLVAVGKGKTEPKIVTKSIAKRYVFLQEDDVLNEAFINQLAEEDRELADQVNRRTEFKVTSTTYNME